VSWKQLLAKGDVKTHQTSKQELGNIRALIARDLADAALAGLSADRRFATAYNAALQAARSSSHVLGIESVQELSTMRSHSKLHAWQLAQRYCC
jgi:hypothetical protein